MSITIVDFREAKNIAQLAIKIGCDEALINELLNSENTKEFYHELPLPKKNKKRRQENRTVWQAASAELANVQKTLLKKFEDFSLYVIEGYPHASSHGFVSGRSIASNASVHLGKKFLLRADITNFFESITNKMLTRFLESIGIHEIVAEGIVALTTVNDFLAQGINTSPLFANLICLELDDALEDMADKYNCRYSRYADDLSFSSDDDLFLIRDEMKNDLSSELKKHQFELSESKFRISKNGQAHFVTGLSISDPKAPHVPKKFKSKLRQELYYIKKNGIQDHSSEVGYSEIENCLNNVDGRINYLKSIEPELGAQFRDIWLSQLEKEGLWPDYQHTNYKINFPRSGYCFIDESEFEMDDRTKVLALALVFTDDPNKVRDAIKNVIGNLKVDDYSTGNNERLDQKGLHFTEDHPDTRSEVVNQMSKMPIQCYIAYQTIAKDNSNYEDVYVKLFNELLKMRLSSKNRYIYSFNIENSTSSLKKRLESSYTVQKNAFELNGTELSAHSSLQIIGKPDDWKSKKEKEWEK